MSSSILKNIKSMFNINIYKRRNDSITSPIRERIKIEEKFKSFKETYKFCALALAMGLIYPNKKTKCKRVLIFIGVLVFNFPELYWFGWYLWWCIIRMDVYNFTRNMTIGMIIILFIFKTFYANYKTDGFAHIIDEITNDLLHGNKLTPDYKEIYENFVKRAKLAQVFWIMIPLLLGTQFTIHSSLCMIYEYMTTDQWTKYMVHEMELQHIQHLQYKSPYFELIFVYNFLESMVLAPNYCGFDGSFCIAITHLGLKLKIIGYSMQRAFNDITDREKLHNEMKKLIKEHQKALIFYEQIQDVYGTWLFSVFLLTSLLISFNVYLIYYIRQIDPKYTLFAISSVVHMFSPCYYASDLIKLNDEFCDDLYKASWETTGDPVATKYLIIMIARSQKPLILTGLGIVEFNMQLFISIMQTSYSFFTLISS